MAANRAKCQAYSGGGKPEPGLVAAWRHRSVCVVAIAIATM